MEIEEKYNPWNVSNLEEFLFYCCPECDMKDVDRDRFLNHVVIAHPRAKNLIDSLDEIHIPTEEESIESASLTQGHDSISLETEPVVKIEPQDDSHFDIEPFQNFGNGSNFDVKIKKEQTDNQDFTISDVCTINPTYQCDQCDKVYAHKGELQIHIRSDHEGIRYECDQCDKSFKKRSHLNIHINSVHKGIQYKCSYCEKIYGQKRHLERHIVTIHSGVRFQCDKCDKSYSEKESLQRHIKAVHEGIRFQCDKCDKSYIMKQDLVKHYQATHEGVRFPCDQCDKTYTRKKHLERHREVVHEVVRYSCDECGKIFTQKGHLNQHVKSIHWARSSMEMLQ